MYGKVTIYQGDHFVIAAGSDGLEALMNAAEQANASPEGVGDVDLTDPWTDKAFRVSFMRTQGQEEK